MTRPDSFARELVTRLKGGGQISAVEREEIRELISRGEGDLHNAVRALALGSPFDPEDFRKLLEILRTTDDDWVAQGAIYALFWYWKVDAAFLDALDRFVEVGAWDQWPSAAIAGISTLGSYALRSDRPDLLRQLVQIADEGVAIQRGCALEAIDVALNGESSLRDRILRGPAEKFDEQLLQRARERIT